MLATKKAKVWQATYISPLVDHHLNGRGRRVSTHLVHEGVMNAIRHPHAAALPDGGLLRRRSLSGGRSLLIVMWDDGDSIISTLRRVTTAGSELVPRKSPLLRAGGRLGNLRLPNRRLDRQGDYLSDRDPVSNKANDAELLILHRYFPGLRVT